MIIGKASGIVADGVIDNRFEKVFDIRCKKYELRKEI